MTGSAATWRGLGPWEPAAATSVTRSVGEVEEFQKIPPNNRARFLTQPDLFHRIQCALTSSDVGCRTELNMAIVRFIRQHRGRKRGLTSNDRLFIPKHQKTVFKGKASACRGLGCSEGAVIICKESGVVPLSLKHQTQS